MVLGEAGLVEATIREMDRLHRRQDREITNLAEILKDSLPGYLKIEHDAADDFWLNWADAVTAALDRQHVL